MSLTVVVVALGIGGILAATWATTSTQSLSDIARIRAGQVTANLARSAVAETWAELQQRVNDPAASVARRLRSADPLAGGAVLEMPGLVHTPDLVGAAERSIQVETRILRWAPVEGWPSDSVGAIGVTARVRGTGGVERTYDEERQFRVQRIGLPVPLHRWVVAPPPGEALQVFGGPGPEVGSIADPAATLRESEAGQTLLGQLSDPSAWRSGRAAFDVPLSHGGASLQSWIEDRMSRDERCNGVVLVDNQSVGLQRLSRIGLRGRMLLVVTGALDLSDVTLENPAADLVSIIAYGPVTVAGRVDAHLLRLVDPAASGGEMGLCSGTAQMTGSVIDLSGLDTCPFLGSLTAGPATRSGSGSGAATDPSMLVVLLSPVRRMGPVTRS